MPSQMLLLSGLRTATMSEVAGKIFSCNRCGDSIFIESNTNLCIPDGWEWHKETGHMCPECSAEWNNLWRFVESYGNFQVL